MTLDQAYEMPGVGRACVQQVWVAAYLLDKNAIPLPKGLTYRPASATCEAPNLEFCGVTAWVGESIHYGYSNKSWSPQHWSAWLDVCMSELRAAEGAMSK